MSQLKEILSTEQERGSLEQCAVIHLFREGTFYRAYEWSAWLCCRYINEFKPTRSPEFAIREARISAFAMRKNNDMRLPWYDSPTTYHLGLSHRGSRRINGKFVGDLWQFVFVVFGVGWQDESGETR